MRPQHTSCTRADSIQIGTERPPRVSPDCLDLRSLASVHTLSVTCSAAIRRTPLHFYTGDDADTCPLLANTQCGQQRRGQRRSELRKVALSILPITLPVGNALARWQLTTCRATRSGFISPFQTVSPTLVGMLLGAAPAGDRGACVAIDRLRTRMTTFSPHFVCGYPPHPAQVTDRGLPDPCTCLPMRDRRPVGRSPWVLRDRTSLP